MSKMCSSLWHCSHAQGMNFTKSVCPHLGPPVSSEQAGPLGKSLSHSLYGHGDIHHSVSNELHLRCSDRLGSVRFVRKGWSSPVRASPLHLPRSMDLATCGVTERTREHVRTARPQSTKCRRRVRRSWAKQKDELPNTRKNVRLMRSCSGCVLVQDHVESVDAWCGQCLRGGDATMRLQWKNRHISTDAAIKTMRGARGHCDHQPTV